MINAGYRSMVGFLSLVILFSVTAVIAAPYAVTITQDSDDGTEMDRLRWTENGVLSIANLMGRDAQGVTYEAGLRFHLDELEQGQEIVYARLRFASLGGIMASGVRLLIEGVLQESPGTFSQAERPSQKLPKTQAQVAWDIEETWIAGEALAGVKSVPLLYSSPDISPIINEIVALPDWGTGSEGKTLIITISDRSSEEGELNWAGYQDYKADSDIDSPVTLEIYRTVYDTFLGKELLGRVTDHSAAVSLFSLIGTDVFVAYGALPGTYTDTSEVLVGQAPGRRITITLSDLEPDMTYYYRLHFRRTGDPSYQTGEERSFHTRRSIGSEFTFAILSDEHVDAMYRLPPDAAGQALFRQTLRNIEEGNPDFFISLGDVGIYGDMFPPDFDPGESTVFFMEGLQRYLRVREYLDLIAHSIPYYLVLGNHEGEQGWLHNGDTTSSAAQFTRARKETIPNPIPDGFYDGNTDSIPGVGLREDYYSWQWGDALFVVLDPFWYTTVKPHNSNGEGSLDCWDWTLGREQYEWLYETLHASDAIWKFVFTHHLTTTTPPCYGSGGIEVAKYKVDGLASFEWGGEDENGNYVFPEKRPGWSHGALHDMLVEEGVAIVFHGHDHFFAAQILDGIMYQECPQPADEEYSFGFERRGGYRRGVLLPNSGSLLVSVNPRFVLVEYIRSFLPGDGENGERAFGYTLRKTAAVPGVPPVR